MGRRVALTTLDNPYDPFDDWVRWYQFDTANGYDTASLLARLVKSTEELGETVYQQSIENAIDALLVINPTLNLLKVVRE